MLSTQAWGVLLTLCAILLAGCGSTGDRPELGHVTGAVTLDGEPLAGAIITFTPDKGRAASAVTDSAGKYTLIYRAGVNGAKIGPHTVSFEWPLGEGGGQAIPAKYGVKSELKAEVAAGNNTLDFALDSK